MYKATDLQN